MLGITISILSAVSAANAYTVIVHEQFMKKNIDPLVYPGEYKSHMHSFFGSDAITKDKPTSAELQQGCASGENPNDLSVYWVPTLYVVDGNTRTEVPPMRFSTYYENILYADAPIPQDFSVIAGSATATSQSELSSDTGLQWFCEGDDGEDKDDAAFPTTTCSTHLQTIFYFHDCVDPSSLNSTYSSGSYGNSNYCPTGYNRIPRLRFSIRYDLRKLLPDGWSGAPPLELASGPSYSMHGDFINGWFEDAATSMLTVAADKREFAQVDGEHGDGKSGPTCVAADADPSGGTDDYDTAVSMMGKKLRRALRRARSVMDRRARWSNY
ncbi:putative short-chain dehydrogenase protein [Neofusicoccum parvum UCRNP2]|uniref:Putative short-chain dehydrogenase protein n=1 Tax=Botryosphaeria parva (strain UCR-NP2) TaxID=1287680 RepID=R1GTP7_BOTPV|nr:putative short-chain dehydrogenase protein [Neofusicoccum parvum UCRNP2]